MDKYLAELRRDYSSRQLDEQTIDPDPFTQFSLWMNEAIDSQIVDANAMTMVTAGAEARPSARVVLLKGYDQQGLVFFTNYESKKAAEIDSNRAVALHFYWPDLERQIAVCGNAFKVERSESEEYFATRPRESQIGAWASKQSSTLRTRQELEERIQTLQTEFEGRDVQCPPFWGGFRVEPQSFEFWQGRPSRLHDRIFYQFADGRWHISRLSP
jgi:pyridoxamine 5'-phosphate oxidase